MIKDDSIYGLYSRGCAEKPDGSFDAATEATCYAEGKIEPQQTPERTIRMMDFIEGLDERDYADEKKSQGGASPPA